MTVEQDQATEVWECSDLGFLDGIEILLLIELIRGQNTGRVIAKLTDANAGDAAGAIRNGLISRITLLVAGAFAPARQGDRHLRRAFELLEITPVRALVAQAGSPAELGEAFDLWKSCEADPRRAMLKHFRDKFTAHKGRPDPAVPLPEYDMLFEFAYKTVELMGKLAIGTGARTEEITGWTDQLATSAFRFWEPWGA